MTNTSQVNKKVQTIGTVMMLATLFGMIANFMLLLGGSLMISFLNSLAKAKTEGISTMSKFSSKLAENFQTNLNSLEEIDLFINTYKNPLIINLSIVFILNTIIGLLTLLIANSWRKGNLFGTNVTRYLKWMGITFIASFAYSLIGSYFVDLSVETTQSINYIYSMILNLEPGMGTLATGLFLLALSYVLKYSNTLEEEVSYTV